MGVFSLVAYQICMFYGICALASAWMWNSTRSIGIIRFSIFGIALPLACCLFNLFEKSLWWSFAIMPLTLGYLLFHGNRNERIARLELTAMQEDELRRADAMIARDPLNATAYWMRGKVYEAREQFAAALDAYRRSHELCPKTISDPESEHLSDWLKAALERQAQQRSRPMWPSVLKNALLFIGLILCFFDSRRGVDVVCLLIFVRWLRSEPRIPASNDRVAT